MRAMIAACVVSALAVTGCAGAVSPAPQDTPGAPGPSVATPSVTVPSATPEPSPTLGFTPGTKGNPRVVELTADDQLTFFPNVVVAAEGETITFMIKNTGKAIHEFMLGPAADAFADKEGTPEVADIGAGETKELTFTFSGPGPYAFACHEPGHFEVGMLGYVVIVGPDVPAAGTAASPRLVEVAMTDQLQFVPGRIAIAAGETVTFLITNEGTVTHEFAVGPVDKVDADEIDGKIVVEADEIEGHHLKTVTYTFDGPGPYGFACHEPGHFEAGMKGAVTIAGSY